jgi:ATP adenylyltransferase
MSNPPLWAPWRMDYITGAKTAGCVFCDLPSRARTPESLREDLVVVVQEHAFVCLNRYPFASSHLLVIPRRHTSSLADLSSVEYGALMVLLRESAERLRIATNAEGLNIGMNLGKVAGAGIAEHLHAHVVPRWSGDTNFMPVIANVRVMPEYLDDAWCRLYPHFTDLEGLRAPAPLLPDSP